MTLMDSKPRTARANTKKPAIMGRILAALGLLLGVAAAVPPGAEAIGLCIVQNPNSTIFIPRFRVPAKGKCKPYTGLVVNGLDAQGASGQACTTPDGSKMLVGLTVFIDDFVSFFEATILLPVGTPPVLLRHDTFSSHTAVVTSASLCNEP